MEKVSYFEARNINPDFYKNVCKADLKYVLDMIKTYYELGIWIEITTLIIPGYNDDENELIQIAEFIKSIDEDIPAGEDVEILGLARLTLKVRRKGQ